MRWIKLNLGRQKFKFPHKPAIRQAIAWIPAVLKLTAYFKEFVYIFKSTKQIVSMKCVRYLCKIASEKLVTSLIVKADFLLTIIANWLQHNYGMNRVHAPCTMPIIVS